MGEKSITKRSAILLGAAVVAYILGFGMIGYYYYTVTSAPINTMMYMQDTSQLSDYLSGIPVGNLTSDEADGLLYMREEEKLARDVYLYFYDLYGSLIFKNIANSEQTHMDAVLLLLNRYNLTDPAYNDTRGVFNNTYLKELYNNLTVTGSESLRKALEVGALIEEVDIKDLEEYIAQTDKEDIITVYNFLKSGSYNHLRAFVGQLAALGVTYSPQILDETEYNSIISESQGKGHGTSESMYMIITATGWLIGGMAAIAAGIIFTVLYFTLKIRTPVSRNGENIT